MPIDPSIALQGITPKFNNPFDVLAKYRAQQDESALRQQQIRSGQAEEEKRRQAIADKVKTEAEQSVLAKVLADPTISQEDAKKQIAAGAPGLYPAYAKAFDEHSEKASQIAQNLASAASSLSKAHQNAQEFVANDAADTLAKPVPLHAGILNQKLQTYERLFPESKAKFEEIRQRVASGADPTEILQGLQRASTAQRGANVAETKQATEQPGQAAQSAMLGAQAAGMQDGLTPDQQRQQAQASAANVVAQQNARTSAGQLGVVQQREGREQKQYDATYGSLQPGSTGDKAVDPLVKSIAEYRQPSVSPRSMASGPGRALMDAVMTYNPDYDAAQFPTRQKTRIAFTSGEQSKKINALNTAIGHLDQLGTAIDGLGNSDVQIVNRAKNWLTTQFGGASVNNFDTIKDALSGEVSNVLSNSGATVSGIADAKQHIKDAGSPAQLAGYLKTQIPILGSKLSSYEYQYHQAMGAKDPFSVLSPDAKAVLVKHGFDPAHPVIGGGSAKKVTMKAPNGQTQDVDASEVEHYKSMGATVVN